ncbi:MAG: universal stress protein, partial [Caldilineae bacterium]
MSSTYHDVDARRRYEQNLRKAQIEDLLGLIRGQNTSLVKFEEVAQRLKARQEVGRRLEQVPLDKIVGSVGRYHDFTRAFLPRPNVNQHRWARLDAALNGLESVPPVELYKIGDVYFVRDGNHRVSVAKANGLDSIEAYVT